MRASLPWASRQASPQRRGGHTDIEAFGNESESLSYERVGMRAHCTGGWKSRCDEVFYVAGFRPGWRGPFVSAKGPKTRLAVVWPFGFPARFADSGVAQTRCAQTMRDFSPVSAALLGHTTRPRETVETMCPLIIVDQLAEPALSF